MSDQHGAPWTPEPNAGEPPTTDTPPATPPAAGPPTSTAPEGAPPWAMRPRAPQAPGPNYGAPTSSYGAGPAPGGHGAAPTTPAAPSPYGATPAPGGYAPAPTPYAGIPSVSQAFPGTAPVPYDRPARRVSVGIPPTLGLAVVFLSFPAIATLGYGLIAVFAGILFSSADTNSEFDFSDGGAALGGIGVVLIILGLIGVASVVGLAAGNEAARVMCTVFVAISMVLQLVGFATNPTGGGFAALAAFMSVPIYCLWAMWGGRSREVF